MLTLLISFIFVSARSFDWQSHRGARGLYPENTIEAMKVGLSHPQITTLEMDVIISKDNEVVVSHEPWLEGEICNKLDGKIPVGKEVNLYQLKYSEIAKFDCGSKIHPHFPNQLKVVEHKPKLYPLLIGLIEEFKKINRKIGLTIEIKSTLEEEKNGYQPNYKIFTDIVIE